MEQQNLIEEVAERVIKVFTDIKKFLEGCRLSEHIYMYQSEFLDRLEAARNKGEPASNYVRDEVATLVFSLRQCSDDLFHSRSLEDVLRVEIVNRFLFSTLQNFKEPFEDLAHLEKLTLERNHFDEEILAYGYAGVTLTSMNSLQITTTELVDSGELALQSVSILEPLIINEEIRSLFWGHLRRFACCFYNMGMHQESIPWYEAALRMANFGSKEQAATSNNELGYVLHVNAQQCDVSARRKEMFRMGVTHLTKSIHLYGDCPAGTTRANAERVSEAHDLIAEHAYTELKDFAISLHHLAKGVETAAANSLHKAESSMSLNYGALLEEMMPAKIEDINASFRQGLKAALKISSGTDETLCVIDRASICMREILVRLSRERPSRVLTTSPFVLPCLKEAAENQFLIQFDESSPSLTLARARALYYLGLDYYYSQGKLEAAIDVLQRGLRTLEAEPTIDRIESNWSQKLSAGIHTRLGQMHYRSATYEESTKHFHLSAQMFDDLKNKLCAWEFEANALFHCGDYVRALEVINEMLMLNLTDSDFSTGRAGLLVCKGTIEFAKSDYEECILSLEGAKTSNEEKNVLETRDLVACHMILVQAYLKKNDFWAASQLVRDFQPIMDKYHKGGSLWHVWQAIKAVGHQIVGDLGSADRSIEKCDTTSNSDLPLEYWWTSIKSGLYRRQKDVDSALEQCDIMEQILKDSEGENPGCLGPAEDSDTITSLLKPKLAEIHLNRAAILAGQVYNKQDFERARDESQKAVLLFRKEAGQEISLAQALACQATAGFALSSVGDRDLENKLIDEAIQLVETRDRLLLAKFKYIKANILRFCDPLTAEAAVREAALIFAELQLNLKDMESAWVSLFGLDMKQLFNFMQELFLDGERGMPMKALLSAERGRARLFVYLIRELRNIDLSNLKYEAAVDRSRADELPHDLQHSLTILNQFDGPRQGLGQVSPSNEEWRRESSGRGCDEPEHRSRPELQTNCVEGTSKSIEDVKNLSGLDELWFDRDDVLAKQFLLQAVAKCGSRTRILEYTFIEEPREHLLIYVVSTDSGDGHVEWTRVHLQEIMEEKREGQKKSKWGATLANLIYKTRELIYHKKDDEAMEGLSLLHSLLIEPVQKYLNNCQRLVLAVHEHLVLVPFAALYNKKTGKFLAQENTISYIPSIRVLHHCFCRQGEFERDMHEGLLGPPFVAGNPQPMGYGMPDLPHAAEEAKLVANILGVQPRIGHDVTKEAIKSGLSNGSMVLLATHGVVETYFPHGALILQGHDNSSPQQVDKTNSNSFAGVSPTRLRGPFFESLRKSPNGTHDEWPDAAINADELASLPGGIRAGLVVLSACKSAAGLVTSEGLLGLGRSLLQGGAPAAILMLWEVTDSTTKDLVAGVFEQLVKQSKDAAEAVQLAMLQMMENKEQKYNICHWAPLVVVGSPFFKYIAGASYSLGTE